MGEALTSGGNRGADVADNDFDHLDLFLDLGNNGADGFLKLPF